jgi:hypothetical protein
MTTAVELLRQGRRDEFWQRYCGFLDLSINEFMAIQERLLTEQLQLLAGCELGRKLFGGKVPLTVSEFRRLAPITTYQDYIPYLTEQREDVLPAKPACWVRTSGSTGEYAAKWAPVSPSAFPKLAKDLLGILTMSSARRKGDVELEIGDILLYAAAPPPYVTGVATRAVDAEGIFRAVPPVAEAERMAFQERVQQGFLRSMGTGIDYIGGVASVLLRMGEAFSSGSRQMTFSPTMLRPSTLARLGRILVSSKVNNRSLLPKDIWRPKGIIATGMDVQVYSQRIKTLWGCAPREAYACTEFGTMACQAWDEKRPGLTFNPDSMFVELMPVADYLPWRHNPAYSPTLLTLNQAQPGEYVLVGTSLGGGAFVRYVIGDLLKVIALRDSELGIDLPQIRMESRVDGRINLGSMVVLTERALWDAIARLDLGPMNWAAKKESDVNRKEPTLHLYFEGGNLDPERFRVDFHEALVETHEEYASFNAIMGINPLRITVLTPGTYDQYFAARQAEGADLGHLKPPRMEPSEQVVTELLKISAGLAGRSK